MNECCFNHDYEEKEIRDYYSEIMEELLNKNDSVVVGDADVGFSVYGKKFSLLHDKYGQRFFDVGIQEGNLIGVSAGMALAGKLPYVAIFAPFLSRRAYDEIFISLAYARLKAKLIGCDPGYTSAYNGGSHSALEDTGIMRCIPDITIVDITDSIMLKWALEEWNEVSKLWYIRMPRNVHLFRVYESNTVFEVGKSKVLRNGKDAVIVSAGLMVAKALQAAECLFEKGIDVKVIDVVTIKPIDSESIMKSVIETKAIVCCDNHRAIGGLCSAVAEILVNCPVSFVFEKVAIGERFGEVGSADYLEKIYGLTVDDIIEKVERVVNKKNEISLC